MPSPPKFNGVNVVLVDDSRVSTLSLIETNDSS